MTRVADAEFDSLAIFRRYMRERDSILQEFAGKWIPYRSVWKPTLPVAAFDTENDCWAYVDEHQIIMETLVLQVGCEPFFDRV